MWVPGSYNKSGEGPGSFIMTSFTRDSASGLVTRTKADALAGGYESSKTIPMNCCMLLELMDLTWFAKLQGQYLSIQDENLTEVVSTIQPGIGSNL